MIRNATMLDKSRCIELLRDSRISAGFDRKDGLTGFTFPFDPAYAERVFLTHITGTNRLCLVHDVSGVAQGILMMVAYEHLFGPVWLTQETLWWIDPSHRGSAAPRMLDAAENWAKEKGYHFTGMAGMGEDPAMAALYRRSGYRIAETHYLKAL